MVIGDYILVVGTPIFTKIVEDVTKMIYYWAIIMILTFKMYLGKYKANLVMTQLPQGYAADCTAQAVQIFNLDIML